MYTDCEKRKPFADSLERQCSPNYTHADLDFIEREHREVKLTIAHTDDKTVIKPTSLEKVNAIIKRLKVKNASGADGISNNMIKRLPYKAVMHTVAIVNAML